MNKWTKEDVIILKENYNKTWEEIQELLPNRTIKSLKTKIYKLGLRRDVTPPYSKEEDEIIIFNKNKDILSYIHLLNNRSLLSVRSRMVLLGLSNLDMSSSDLIVNLYVKEKLSISMIAKRLNMNKHVVSGILNKLEVNKRVNNEISVATNTREIIDLYNYGFNMTDIHKMYGYSRDIIRRILIIEDIVIHNKRKVKSRSNDNKHTKNRKSLRDSRKTKRYKDWRKEVLERDEHTCQCCLIKTSKLDVHHVENYLKNSELRLEITNGITLCQDCHSMMKKGSFHNMYGTYDNDIFQLQEYFDSTREWLGLPLINIEDIIYKDYIFED